MNKKVFIGCPISHYFEGNEYNKQFRNALLQAKKDIERRGNTLYSAPIEEKFQRLNLLPDEQIVQRDFSWIDKSDICIFFFPTDSTGSPIQTEGTCIELGYSIAHGKTILIFWDSSNESKYSPMLRGLEEFNATYHDVVLFQKVVSSIE